MRKAILHITSQSVTDLLSFSFASASAVQMFEDVTSKQLAEARVCHRGVGTTQPSTVHRGIEVTSQDALDAVTFKNL